MEGKGTLEFDTELFHLRAGDFYIIPPEVYYAISVDVESLCLFLNLRRSFVISEYTNIFLGDYFYITDNIRLRGLYLLSRHTYLQPR